MSEQFSLQPEEVESANDRLDSILDRLQALGASADALKQAPLRPLQSVPDLPPSVLSPVPEPQTAQPPTELTPPAVPDLDLVPPIQPAESPVVEQLVEAPIEAVVEAPVEPEQAAPVAQTDVAEITVVEQPLTSVFGETTTEAPPEVPTSTPDPALVVSAPASMFDLVSAPTDDQPPTTTIETDIPGDVVDDPDGWVSHHDVHVDEHQADEASDYFETPEFPRDGDFDEPVERVDATVESSIVEVATPSADEVLEPAWADDVDAIVGDEPHVAAETPALDGESFDALDNAPTVSESDDGHDFFAAMDDSQPVAIAGIEHLMDTTELYETDEDLPLPDFTGVYTGAATQESTDDELVLPEPIESSTSGTGSSTARDELDRLRPVEEEIVAEEKSSRNLSLRLQFFSVLAFGIMALVVVWLNDPSFVDDIQRSIENLIG